MSDLISRSALIEFARNHFGGEIDCNDIARFPAVDAVPVVHARWNHNGPDFPGGIDWYSCSACGNRDAVVWMKYCPKCGAKLDGGADNASD